MISPTKSTGISKLKKYQKNIVTSFVLGVFFINSNQPIKIVEASEISAPTTINNKTEKVSDYDKFNNEILQVIHDDTDIVNESRAIHLAQEKIVSISPGSVSDTIKGYQNKILETLRFKTDSKEAVTSIIANSYKTLRDTVQRAYVSEPFSSGSIALLFNENNYLKLRKDAELEKQRRQKEAADNKKRKLALLKENFIKSLKDLKTKFEKSRILKIARLTSLKNSQNSKINKITKEISNIPNKIARIKRKMKERLNSISYFSRKSSEHKSAYKHYKKEYKHAKSKYKKYKKKYKKKKKSKYKSRYKKYKKRYKKNEKRYKSHKDTYKKYTNKKNKAYRDYKNLEKELRSLRSSKSVLQTQLELTKKQRNVSLVKLNLQPASIDDISKYQQTITAAKKNYDNQVVVTEKKYEDDLKNTEDNYDSNLQKAEVYKSIMDELKYSTEYFIEESKELGQEKLQFEIALRDWIEKETKKQKHLATERIEQRKNVAENVAASVFAGMIKNPKNLLNAFGRKLISLKGDLTKMRGKVKKLKEAYEENKKYKKKMKDYKKDYEKYAKKVKKYKGKNDKRSKKKYKKYLNKRESKLKKYKKYKEKYEKYGSLKKAYKSGYHQAKDVYKQFENQYKSLLKQKNDLKLSYNKTYTEASSFRDALLRQANLEYVESKKQLQTAETIDEYSLIGTHNNDDIRGYLKFIPATVSTSLANISFSGGFDALSSIKKSLEKIRSKAKKSYEKHLKKIKKEQEKQRRLQEEYRKKIAWQNYQIQQANLKAERERLSRYTQYDKFGNGYSSAYSNPISSFAGYTGFGTVVSTLYKPKSQDVSWLNKIGGKIKSTWDWSKSTVSNLWKNTKNTTIALGNYIKDTTITTAKTIGTFTNNQIIKPAINFGNSVKNVTINIAKGVYNFGKTTIKTYIAFQKIKKIAIEQASKAMYNNIKRNAIDIADFIKRNSQKLTVANVPTEATQMANFAELASNDEKEIPEGYTELTTKTELEKYGLTVGMLKSDGTGFGAKVFIDEKTGEIIVSFAGTNPLSPKDWWTDARQAMGFETEQYDKAERIARGLNQSANVDFTKLTFVGHSLGGGLASLAGAITDSKTITFNSAGLHQNTLERAGVTNNIFNNITSYIHKGDILKFIQEDNNSTKRILPDPLGNPVYYGSDLNATILGITPTGKMIRYGNGLLNHSDYKN